MKLCTTCNLHWENHRERCPECGKRLLADIFASNRATATITITRCQDCPIECKLRTPCGNIPDNCPRRIA